MKTRFCLALLTVTPVLASLPLRADEPAFGPLPPIKKVEIGPNGEYRVNGRPLVLIKAWLQQPKDFKLLRSLGFNAMGGYWWNKKETPADQAARGILEYARKVREAGLYYLPPYEHELMDSMKTLRKMDHVMLWLHIDEPDLPRKRDPNNPADRNLPPDVKFVPQEAPSVSLEKYRRIKQLDPTRPVVIGVTANFSSLYPRKFTPAQKKAMYPRYIEASDAVGFDTYPIFGWNRPDNLFHVAVCTRELRALAGPKRGLSCAIETNRGSKWITPARQLEVKPMHTRAEVWMALINGATGISYFTHKWFDPDGKANYQTFAPNAEMQAELKRLNAQLARLAPAIVGKPSAVQINMTMSDGMKCHFKATEPGDGCLWVFAQNMDMGYRKGTATITVPGLPAGAKVEVVDEGRTIPAEAGKLADDFGPVAEHIYKIPWRSTRKP